MQCNAAIAGLMTRPLLAWFTFDSCNSGSMNYDSQLGGYGSGSLGLKRLTNLSGLECQ
jgi:hypothetical protein